jgi:hypothetical protein
MDKRAVPKARWTNDLLCAGCGEVPIDPRAEIYCASCATLAEAYPDEDPTFDPEDDNEEDEE